MRRVIIQGLVCIVLAGALFIPPISLANGIKNNKEFVYATHSLSSLRVQNTQLLQSVTEKQNQIMKYGESKGINVNSVTSLYNIISKLKGVTGTQAQIVNFGEDGSTIQVCSYTPSVNVSTANGIKIELSTSNVSDVLKEIENLRIPYYSLNIVFPENKLTIVYNTGGLNNV